MSEYPFPPAALDVARRLLRQLPLTADALQLLLDCLHAALLRKAASLEFPVTLPREDAKGCAADYVTRLLNPKFGVGWRQLDDVALNRKIIGDLYGKRRENAHPGWLYRAVMEHAEDTAHVVQPTERDAAPLERADRAAAECFYRSSPDKARRGESEYAADVECEARLLTFRRCLREFRLGDWIAPHWKVERWYAAHALVWYERNKPAADLKNYQLAYVFGISEKVASTYKTEAAQRLPPAPEGAAAGVPEFTALFYELRLADLFSAP